MSDRLFFSLAGVAAVLIIALALVWPQGLGAPSPWPFRRPLGPVDPEVTAAREAAARKAQRPHFTRPPLPARPGSPGAPALRERSPALPALPAPGGQP
ncbi:MAG: hypothetical protein INR64_00420 [Caulobacteraceae bacterium]|nr:hypothetical protein [Caulobacter sp.]